MISLSLHIYIYIYTYICIFFYKDIYTKQIPTHTVKAQKIEVDENAVCLDEIILV